MKKFRLPRKIKKKLSGKIFLYPEDEKTGSSLMAFPLDSQEDYDAVKKGIAKDIFTKTKAELKRKSEEWDRTYHVPITVSDEKLKEMVDDVFGEEFRKLALSMLNLAKTHPVAINDYYTFINAYNLDNKNICAMCYDSLEINLKRSKPKK